MITRDFTTSVDDSFGVPADTNIATSKYLETRNSSYSEAFHNEVIKVQRELGTQNVFPAGEGLPVTKLIYSDNFSIMTFASEYRTINGEIIPKFFSVETPWYALSRVRANPAGHVIEAISDALIGDLLSKTADFGRNPLRIAEYVKKNGDRELWKELSTQLGDRAGEVAKKVQSGFEAFMQDLDTWLKSYQTDSDVSNPFTATADEVQFLHLLPSTDRLSRLRDQKIYDVMFEQDTSPFIERVRSGELRPAMQTVLP